MSLSVCSARRLRRGPLHQGSSKIQGPGRLDDVRVEARFARPGLVLRAAEPGHGDQARRVVAERGSDPLGDLVAVEARHPDVEQRHVGPRP